jgi:hypothetical protein
MENQSITKSYIARHGKKIPIEVAIMIAKQHGVARSDVLSYFKGLTVKTKEFFNWLGY